MSGQSRSNFSTKTFPIKPVEPVTKTTWFRYQFAICDTDADAFSSIFDDLLLNLIVTVWTKNRKFNLFLSEKTTKIQTSKIYDYKDFWLSTYLSQYFYFYLSNIKTSCYEMECFRFDCESIVY